MEKGACICGDEEGEDHCILKYDRRGHIANMKCHPSNLLFSIFVMKVNSFILKKLCNIFHQSNIKKNSLRTQIITQIKINNIFIFLMKNMDTIIRVQKNTKLYDATES